MYSYSGMCIHTITQARLFPGSCLRFSSKIAWRTCIDLLGPILDHDVVYIRNKAENLSRSSSRRVETCPWSPNAFRPLEEDFWTRIISLLMVSQIFLLNILMRAQFHKCVMIEWDILIKIKIILAVSIDLKRAFETSNQKYKYRKNNDH